MELLANQQYQSKEQVEKVTGASGGTGGHHGGISRDAAMYGNPAFDDGATASRLN